MKTMDCKMSSPKRRPRCFGLSVSKTTHISCSIIKSCFLSYNLAPFFPCLFSLLPQWRHYERGGVSYHRRLDCLPNVCSGADQRKHQSAASLAFVRGIHRWPVDSPQKGPVTRKMFPFDDVIIFPISSRFTTTFLVANSFALHHHLF